MIAALAPVRERYQALVANPAELDTILVDGAERARSVAEPKIRDVKEKVGYLAHP